MVHSPLTNSGLWKIHFVSPGKSNGCKLPMPSPFFSVCFTYFQTYVSVNFSTSTVPLCSTVLRRASLDNAILCHGLNSICDLWATALKVNCITEDLNIRSGQLPWPWHLRQLLLAPSLPSIHSLSSDIPGKRGIIVVCYS